MCEQRYTGKVAEYGVRCDDCNRLLHGPCQESERLIGFIDDSPLLETICTRCALGQTWPLARYLRGLAQLRRRTRWVGVRAALAERRDTPTA